MSTTQEGRLLKVSTPLDEDFLLIKRIRGREGLSQLFSYSLELLHEEDAEGSEPTLVDPQDILGQPMAVTVEQADGTQRFFNGICADFTQGNRNDRFSKYRAEIVPKVWVLTQISRSRIFQNMSVPEILDQVFEGFEFDNEAHGGGFEPRNYCVQYRETDWDFASRLMEEEGIYYYFEHSASSHRLIIANSDGSHRECPSKSEVPFAIDTSSLTEWTGQITTWQVANKLRSGRFTLRDHNFQLPTNSLEGSQVSRFNIGGNQDLEIYDFPGGYAKRFDGIDSGGGDQPSVLQKVFNDRQRTVDIRQQEIDVAYKSSYGSSDCCTLTAGYRFRLTEHPTSENNRNHILVTLQIEAVQSPGYVSDDGVTNAYMANFSCIPQGDQAAPFRPLRRTPKPVVNGSQTAVVVGPSGEEIFTDKYGRVKVQFHWDRDGQNNATSSCWLRVSTSIAGNKWGTMFIPRIGQEVIVDFLEGDPDQPIITGSVYNPATMPHYELPKFKTLTYIKTRTSPDDGKGFNELRFEDKAGKEQVFIRSNKRMDVRARGSLYETCGGNRQEVIGVRSDNQPGGNLAITVGGNYDLHIKADQYVGIDGKLNEGIKGDLVEEVQGKRQVVVTGKNELNAQEITLEALNKISLKVGGSFVTIDLSGVTISGPMVKINSGGAAMGTGPATIDDPLDAETADTGEPGYLDRPRTGGGGGRRRRTLRGQHAPPFATRTLPNGDIQVGNGLIIRNDPNDPSFQGNVLRDLTTMSNYPTGMNTLNSLNNSGQTTTIQHTTVNGGNQYTPNNVGDAMPAGSHGNFQGVGPVNGTGNGTGGTIDYNPDYEPPTAADPTVNRPADVGLHHEMSHSDHAAHGDYDITTADPAQPNNPHMEESNTIANDNAYRTERGIPTRADHTVL